MRLRRDEQELETNLVLAGELAPYQHPFLGILPSRKAQSKELQAKDSKGLTVRGVWPNSPAAEAGITAGDCLLKIGETEVKSDQDARKAIQALHPTAKTECDARP